MPEWLPSERDAPRFEARQHPIALVTRKPDKGVVVVLAVLLIIGLIWRDPMLYVFSVVFALAGWFRWRLWRAERVWLTSKRIVHVQGVLETSRTEAWLRLDRISGMRITESAIGRWLGYATIYVEAPGDHPGLRRLFRISKALSFYRRFRELVIEGSAVGDPDFDDVAGRTIDGDYITERLPSIPEREVEDGRPWRRPR